MNYKLEALKNSIKEWFDSRGLDTAVVGFSGGIDSTLTAVLLDASGVKVHALVVNACKRDRDRIYPLKDARSSIVDLSEIGAQFPNVSFETQTFPMSHELSLEGMEAALPIIRNAYFYARAATLRASGKSAIVVGTTNLSEAAFLGFWGKASDAAQDFYPISHLTKSEVYDLAKELNVPKSIIDAEPSGDLQWSGETCDKSMIGVSYNVIDGLVKNSSIHDVKSVQYILKNLSDEEFNKLRENIVRNKFKYSLPFPGFHLSNKLEAYRIFSYGLLIEEVENEYAQR